MFHKNSFILARIFIILISILVVVNFFLSTPFQTVFPKPIKAAVNERGRPQIVNNLLVADNGWPIRGENPRLLYWPENPTNSSYWNRLRDVFHLNTVRVIAYREPQNYNSSACGFACESRWDLLNASDVDINKDGQLTGDEKTKWDTFMDKIFPYLDTWVDEAAKQGFYVIIDYHPVGGLDKFDAGEWWAKVAPRYKDRPHVIYELANEPVGNPSWGPAGYTSDMIKWEEDMYLFIRSLAPSTHIILWSFANAASGMDTVVAQAPKVNYSNASVAFHIYGYSTSAINSLKASYPVFASEMGGTSTAEYNDKVSYVESVGVKSWIILDGTLPQKAVTVTWSGDPYYSSSPQSTPTPTPTSTPISACTVTVPLTVASISASQSPYDTIRPGDTVCIAAGTRGSLEIKNFKGSEGMPITFVNSGGKVRIDANQDWMGMYLKNDEYIHLTGTGDSAITYGFEVYNSPSHNGIIAGAKTRYMEIDHMEVHDIGSISAKTAFGEIVDTNNNGTVRDEWTQYGTYIHHNWLHDTNTEGLYVGSSFWEDGKEPLLDGVELAYNKIERTGWDGLQVGSATKNVKVHHNIISDAGLSESTNSGNGRFGIIVNGGTTGDFYNNKIYNSRSAGVYIQGIGNYRFYNNLVYNSGVAKTSNGIRWALGDNGQFYDNTIVNTNGNGMSVSSWISGGSIYDNIIAGSTSTDLSQGNITALNNLTGSINIMRFIDPVNENFHLRADSPAVDAGSSSGLAPFDLDDISRPQGVKADIGAYEYIGVVPSSPTPTPTPIDIKDILAAYATSQVGFDLNNDGKVNSFDFAISTR